MLVSKIYRYCFLRTQTVLALEPQFTGVESSLAVGAQIWLPELAKFTLEPLSSEGGKKEKQLLVRFKPGSVISVIVST